MSRLARCLHLVVVLLAPAAALAQVDVPRPEYPEGAAIPRHATAEELRYLEANPLGVPKAFPAAPTGELHCTAEYEPVESIVVAWEGQASWRAILAQMASFITTLGQADFFVSVDSTTEQDAAALEIEAAGADMTRVRFIVASTDTIWMRDYGPRYAYESGCRVVIDHTYNRPRPADDSFPIAFAALKGHARYTLPLIHGGGNFHLDARGSAFATQLIANENPMLSEAAIQDLWRGFQGLDTTILEAFPRSVDSTQHLDMWMIFASDTRVLVSDWPFDVGSIQDVICDAAALRMAALGYEVFRVPARSVNGVHYTYTNAVICNGLVLIPSYTNAQVMQHDLEALAAWQAALPGHVIIRVPCQNIVTASGVMHCIVMHVPPPVGGELPTAHLRWPGDCDQLVPGEVTDIDWITDDDVGITDVDLELSLDGGMTWPVSIASAIPDSGSYPWLVPDLPTSDARVRVVARDADGNVGSDASDRSFRIGDPSTAIRFDLPLLVSRTLSTLTLGVPASPDATSYNIYSGGIGPLAGDVADFAAADALDCGVADADPRFQRHPDSTLSVTGGLPVTDQWFLVTARNCYAESPLTGILGGAPLCGPER